MPVQRAFYIIKCKDACGDNDHYDLVEKIEKLKGIVGASYAGPYKINGKEYCIMARAVVDSEGYKSRLSKILNNIKDIETRTGVSIASAKQLTAKSGH